MGPKGVRNLVEGIRGSAVNGNWQLFWYWFFLSMQLLGSWENPHPKGCSSPVLKSCGESEPCQLWEGNNFSICKEGLRSACEVMIFFQAKLPNLAIFWIWLGLGNNGFAYFTCYTISMWINNELNYLSL